MYTRGEENDKKTNENRKQQKQGSWFGVNPQTKIVPNKKKENDKRKCKGKVV